MHTSPIDQRIASETAGIISGNIEYRIALYASQRYWGYLYQFFILSLFWPSWLNMISQVGITRPIAEMKQQNWADYWRKLYGEVMILLETDSRATRINDLSVKIKEAIRRMVAER